MDEMIVNFAVYEDGIELLGFADVKFPDINFLTNTISGAGIAGRIESVAAGMVDAMTTTMNFNTVTDASISLTEPRAHKLDLRVAQQRRNNGSGQLGVESFKHVLIATPKKLTIGKAAPASTGDVSGDYSTSYYAMYKAGKKLIEIDPVNFICIVNGVDYLADVRSALGK
jgi:P2 family phage contractile tail tube protein